MYLLDLSNGGASLEFSPGEAAAVMARSRAMGEVTVRHEATFDVLSIGSEEITYLDEWDQPCLIAGTPSGRALLATVLRDRSLSIAAE